MPIRLGLVILSLILSVLIGFVVARGGGSGSAAGVRERPVIGLSLDTLKEERWQRDRDTFVAACTKLGADVRVVSANSDDRTQTSDIESLISQRVDCLVVVPHDGAAMAGAVDRAAVAGIPVMAYDRLITGTSKLDLYVTFDNVTVGRQQAEFLAQRFAGRNWKVVRIYGSPSDNNAKLFKQGQDEILNPLIKAGQVQVVHEDWAIDWKPENGKKITSAAITRYGEAGFDAILASNDGTAAGAIEALREAGMVKRVVVTGQDAELAAVQRIALDEQAMTIYKPLPVLAKQAAELAVRMAQRKPVVARMETNNGPSQVPSVFAAVQTVTKENIMSTVVAESFHTYEAIFGNMPADKRPPKPAALPEVKH